MTIEGEPWVLGGDIIVGINGQDVKNSEQYAKVFRQLKAKQAVTLKLYRDGRRTLLMSRWGNVHCRPVLLNVPK